MTDNQEKPEAPEAKKQEKGPSGLEAIVNDGKAFINGLIATGAITAGLFLGAGNATTLPEVLVRGAPAASVVASQPLSAIATQQQPSTQRLKNDSIYGLIQLPVFDYLYKTAFLNASTASGLVNLLGYSIPKASLVAGGITIAAAPFLTAGFYPIAYFLRNNYSFKGFAKELKENYLKTTAITAGTFGLITGAAAGAATMFPAYAAYLLFPAAALGNIAFNIVNSYYRKKPEEREGLLRYTAKSLWNTTRLVTYPVSGALSLTAKITKGLYESVIAIGSSVRDLLKKAPTPAAPATAPAPKPA